MSTRQADVACFYPSRKTKVTIRDKLLAFVKDAKWFHVPYAEQIKNIYKTFDDISNGNSFKQVPTRRPT